MRDIEFRGLTKDGKLVKGSLLEGPDYCLILRETDACRVPKVHSLVKTERGIVAITSISVIPETVGQYIGLKDKNGIKAYKSDLFVSEYRGCEPIEIVWQDGSWNGRFRGTSGQWHFFLLSQTEMSLSEIIGNIHQHPKLLEK